MKELIKNPIAKWLYNYLKNTFLIVKNCKLKISTSATARDCTFGYSNAIYERVTLSQVKLGNFTYISNGTKIHNTHIGSFCSIGPDCKIGLGKHPTSNFVSTHPSFFSIQKQAGITFSDKNYFSEDEAIKIGSDVWIGAGSIILDGITIGTGSIIGAGSVVTKNVAPYAIVAGVPAKLIRFRFTEAEIEQLLQSKWWENDVQWFLKNYKLFHNIKSFPFKEPTL